MVPEIWSASDRIFLSFGATFFLFTIINTENQNSEQELRVRDLWITNQFLDLTGQKLVKLPFLTDNFKIISADNICVPLSRVKWIRLMKEKKICQMFGLILYYAYTH